MKKEIQSQSQSAAACTGKKLLTSKEAAEYLGIDYCNFRKMRNKGYFGRDRYPAPKFINIGVSETGIRYRVTDLNEWLENFPTYNSTALHFKQTAEAEMYER